MEKPQHFIVEITPQAEQHYWELLLYLYQTHSVDSAEHKSDEILNLALSLDNNPYRGRIENQLEYLNKSHRFLVYFITNRKTVKIIYFVENNIVYVTDFFTTEMDPDRIKKRN